MTLIIHPTSKDIFMKIVFLLSLLSVSGSCFSNRVTLDDRLYTPVYLGTCQKDKENFYLNEAFFISNNILKMRLDQGFILIEKSRDSIRIETYDAGGKPVGYSRTNISSLLNNLDKKNHNLDIRLSFVYIGGNLGVYWRETFENRPFKQGIFTFGDKWLTRIERDLQNVELELKPLCHGSGGVFSSH